MRQPVMSVIFGVVLGALLGSLTACDQPYDPDRPAIDPNAPRVHITSPERGTFAGDVATLVVRGTAIDDTMVTSVTVNGVPAVVHEDGSFEATVPVEPGTNLLHAVAKDPQGNTGKETRAVVAGTLSPIARKVPSGITAALSAQTFDALGRGAAGFLAAADLGALIAPANPVIDMGTTNGQPDCLYGQTFVTGVDLGGAAIQLAPQAAGVDLDVTLDDVRIDAHLQWAVACLDGSRNVTATASKVRIRGLLALGIENGRFAVKLQNTQVTLTNFNVDLGGVPQTIIDLLDLDTRLGPVLAWAAEKLLVPMLNNALSGLNETKSIDLLGKTIDLAVAPARIKASVVGAVVELDTELRAQGDGASPGFVYVKNVVPAMDESQGFQLAVADDAANQLLGSFWAAKGMEIALDLANGPYGEVGRLYDRVELSAKVPPHLDANGDRLRLTIGDFLATFRDGGAVATQIAINAQVDLRVVHDPDGKLRLDVGAPTVYVDILDENVDGANVLSSAQFEAISTFALARVVAFGSSAIGAVPLPSVGGVSMQNVTVLQQTGYVIVDGEIQ
ncbi:MAG TPA: hypothetical protein VN253_30140 [Kofleriaceae bacterium]|nr:hypothetical protein [Kofleriaceae bacterium]